MSQTFLTVSNPLFVFSFLPHSVCFFIVFFSTCEMFTRLSVRFNNEVLSRQSTTRRSTIKDDRKAVPACGYYPICKFSKVVPWINKYPIQIYLKEYITAKERFQNQYSSMSRIEPLKNQNDCFSMTSFRAILSGWKSTFKI